MNQEKSCVRTHTINNNTIIDHPAIRRVDVDVRVFFWICKSVIIYFVDDEESWPGRREN